MSAKVYRNVLGLLAVCSAAMPLHAGQNSSAQFIGINCTVEFANELATGDLISVSFCQIVDEVNPFGKPVRQDAQLDAPAAGLARMRPGESPWTRLTHQISQPPRQHSTDSAPTP